MINNEEISNSWPEDFNEPPPKSTPTSPETGESAASAAYAAGGNPPETEEEESNVDTTEAIFPPGGSLDGYMSYARNECESADVYLIGSILPVIARVLGRRVWFPWGAGRIYPNIYTILAGKPGDRKSSAISLAEKVAGVVVEGFGMVINPSGRLTASVSAEALFDEYDTECNGCPDKVLLQDEGNVFLGTITKTQHGERVGQLLLSLYDCKHLAENYKRNKGAEGETTGRRYIAETSTSICLGATFNIASFQGAEIRAGLQRRFLYYVAQGHGRTIAIPPLPNPRALDQIAGLFSQLKKLHGPFKFSPEAEKLWVEIQYENRRKMQLTDNEAEAGRLNGEPMNILKIAMIFSVTGETVNPRVLVIDQPALTLAAEHVELCNYSAGTLEAVANKEADKGEAQVLLEKVQSDFGHTAKNGEIVISRVKLNRAYARNPGRNSLSTHQIKGRLLPILKKQKEARLLNTNGKEELWAFIAPVY